MLVSHRLTPAQSPGVLARSNLDPTAGGDVTRLLPDFARTTEQDRTPGDQAGLPPEVNSPVPICTPGWREAL